METKRVAFGMEDFLASILFSQFIGDGTFGL